MTARTLASINAALVMLGLTAKAIVIMALVAFAVRLALALGGS